MIELKNQFWDVENKWICIRYLTKKERSCKTFSWYERRIERQKMFDRDDPKTINARWRNANQRRWDARNSKSIMTNDDHATKTSSKATFKSIENDRLFVILSLFFIISINRNTNCYFSKKYEIYSKNFMKNRKNRWNHWSRNFNLTTKLWKNLSKKTKNDFIVDAINIIKK